MVGQPGLEPGTLPTRRDALNHPTASGRVMVMVGQPGLEPGTSVLSGLRSNRLSYWPVPTDEKYSLYINRTQGPPRLVGAL